jgi:transposase
MTPPYKSWLKAQPDGFVDGVVQAALDPFRGYANAIHDGLPDAVAVLRVSSSLCKWHC